LEKSVDSCCYIKPCSR